MLPDRGGRQSPRKSRRWGLLPSASEAQTGCVQQERQIRTPAWGAPMSGSPSAPELLPVLSRGKHRNPRKGACFMEMASVLAGERWSDPPKCTHPLLADLARLVNDCTSDESRHQLAVLIPSVVGLTSDDMRLDTRIMLRCATTALPVA